MLEAAQHAFVTMFQPYQFAMMGLGVAVGLLLGALPGLGGMVGMSLLVPFVWGMEPTVAVAMLVGMLSVVNTADSIPSVLFGVPGTGAAVATIMEGYPLAKKGRAGQAFGAAFMSSMMGGLIGAVVLTLSIPIARPIVLAFGSPEFFMLCLLGITMVAVLTGSRPLHGLLAASLGLILAAVGGGGATVAMRYTFDIPYLFGGIPLIVAALGLFALPEIADLLIEGTSISQVPKLGTGFLQGAKDVFRHWFILLRCSIFGAYIGFVPGLGGNVASWLSYGHVVQTSKPRNNFGKGDIRGVIAPESANNACVPGALIPTIAFGIPGSGTMAIMLIAFEVLGIYPGRDMLTTHLDVTFTMVWSVAVANVMAAGVCFLLSRPLAQLTTVKVHYWVPFVLMLVIAAAFQSTRDWGDLVLLLGFGLLGWFMKRAGWPRPPLIVAFILGQYLEIYLYRSIASYGAAWILSPWVIGIGVFTAVSVIMAVRWQRHASAPVLRPTDEESQ